MENYLNNFRNNDSRRCDGRSHSHKISRERRIGSDDGDVPRPIGGGPFLGKRVLIWKEFPSGWVLVSNPDF